MSFHHNSYQEILICTSNPDNTKVHTETVIVLAYLPTVENKNIGQVKQCEQHKQSVFMARVPLVTPGSSWISALLIQIAALHSKLSVIHAFILQEHFKHLIHIFFLDFVFSF